MQTAYITTRKFIRSFFYTSLEFVTASNLSLFYWLYSNIFSILHGRLIPAERYHPKQNARLFLTLTL